MSTDFSIPWILYLAIQYASAPSLHTLSNLILKFPNIFSKKIILDILNFIPESTEPEEYLSLIFYGKYEGEDDIDSSQISKIQDIDDATLLQKLEKLNIYQNNLRTNDFTNDEKLYIWFISRAQRIEEETGLISLSRKLVLTSKYPIPLKAREWGHGIVTTLESVINREYNNPSLEFNIPTLKQFEALDYKKAIDILLQHLKNDEILKEISSSVIPYISYHQKLSKENVWDSLWSWLLNFNSKQKNLNLMKLLSSNNIVSAEEYENFSKYAMASCYCCKNIERENIHSMKIILQNLKQNLNIETNKDNSVLSDIKISSLNIFTPENMQNYLELITPNFNSLSLLEIMIKTVSIINSQKGGCKITLAEAICYRNKESKLQISLLHKMIPQNPEFLNKFNDSDWIKLRNDIEWLHNVSFIYKNIPRKEYESFLLYNMLKATKFDLVKNIYIKTNKKNIPLEDETVKKICIEVFLEFFDNSSGESITKGNMKNAYNLLQMMKRYYNSQQLEHFSYLINATDALNQYFHRFTPAEIRLHNNPFEILEDFLSSNPGIYKSVDKVIKISNDLILGLNKNYLVPEKETQGKILCIIAETALSQNDFNFAYDICINNLFSLFETDDIETIRPLKNIIWKSCFQISKKHEIKEESLENIKKKMYLLSKVINICPKEHLIEILNVWRQFEKEQLSIKAQKDLSKLNNNLMTRYSNITGSIHIPKSLFSSASKAARTLGTTLSSTSFPFSKQKISYIAEKNITKKHLTNVNEESRNSNNKLDNLADIVTQKFTSGLGWVFGISED
ncbi:uncharacterized protein T551_00236 [Pneumocystis jirovecii RU7]|uniref:Sec39 domain-containing protein n=1 Tax=Pneumocystis jirovecii (strain RU7) TaxID=1408657 RepID=A0A0W4ZWK2_PNEJ7|nr:uncharacterized protein T551_00236 [Pneumocystis jirovecii RU7]KTW32751.1 hypothetical protein T551_00236 [Pneumocystis jirovecii RU7]